MWDSSNRLQKLLFRDNPGEFRQGTVCFFPINKPSWSFGIQIYKASKDKASNQQKVVYMLSTCHSTNIVYTGKNNKDGNCIIKPAIVRSYNQHVGGVDRVDQQLHGINILPKHYT